MMKNMPASALDNPFAKQQKMLLYVLPLFFAVSGVNFPIGVLLYWLTTNVWSMCQQFYVIRRMPAPGSPAEKAMQERRAQAAASRSRSSRSRAWTRREAAEAAPSPAASAQQPTRNKKKKGGRPSRRASRRPRPAPTQDPATTDN